MALNKILAMLDEGRIFSIELTEDKKDVILTEECDRYFEIELDREQFGVLIAELQKIHAKMC